MSKLVSKLAEQSVSLCNSLIQKNEEANTKSRESLFQKQELLKLSQQDLVDFKSNTELLENE
jgi:hypothetical protein